MYEQLTFQEQMFGSSEHLAKTSHSQDLEKDICVKLIEDHCWHFVIGEQFYDEDNIEEFKELFD